MHETLIEGRILRSYRERILPATRRVMVPLDVTSWTVPWEPVPFANVPSQTFTPLAPGASWGAPWGTTWLRIAGRVPAEWGHDRRRELVVDLGFLPSVPGFQAEGLAYADCGRIIKAVEPRNNYVPVAAGPGELFTIFVEAASNPDIGAGGSFQPSHLGDPATAGSEPLYRFGGAWLCAPDPVVGQLERDWWTLQQNGCNGGP